MTEHELRSNVRRQIILNFHENKDHLAARENDKVSLLEVRRQVRKELLRRLNEEAEAPDDADVEMAAEKLDGLDSLVKGIIGTGLQKIQKGPDSDGKKKTEAIGTVVTFALAAPGLLDLMSKLAKLIAKGLQKVTKSKKFDPEQEGKTFEHAAHHLHHKYIKWLVPVVKVVFKKQIAGDQKKAEIYAEVLYAVILAAIAGHAIMGAGAGILEGLKNMGHIFHTAYEAAHGAHVGLEVSQMGSGIRAALAAIGEKEAAAELTQSLAAA